MVSEFKPFLGLLIFGNIENLVLASQGAVLGYNPLIVIGLSLTMVIIWLLIGNYGTKAAIKHANLISFIGGLAIFLLGIESMVTAFFM